MNHILHNYRSDIALVEIFYRYDEEKNEMVATEIPDVEIDFEFTYRAEDNREFTAGRKAGAYFNCKPITNNSIEVYIPLSRHQLGTGILVHFLNLHTPNGNFPEGVQNICVLASTSYMLHKGPSEPITTAATSILGSEVFGRAFTIEVLHDAGAETPYCLPDGGSAAVRAMQRYLSADRDTTQILFVLRDAQTGEQSYDFATAVNDCKESVPDGGERKLLTLGGSMRLAGKRYLLQLTYDKTAKAFDPIVCNLLPSGMAQTTGDNPDWVMSQRATTRELTQVRTDFAEGDRLTLQSANKHTDTAVSDEANKRTQGDTATLQSANEHTDTAVADEANKRTQGDASTLQAAKGYTDTQLTGHDASDSAHAAIRNLFKPGATISAATAALAALGSNYKDVYALACTLKAFLEARDTADTTINTWREIEDFLNGLTDRETLTGLMEQEHRKLTADYDAKLSTTVTLGTEQTITGVKEFTQSVTSTGFVKSGGTNTQVLMADRSVTMKHMLSMVTDLDWSATAGQIITIDTLAFWDGSYKGGASNLRYCNKGQFGDVVTKSMNELDSRYVTASGGKRLVMLTTAQYNALSAKDANTLYIITD